METILSYMQMFLSFANICIILYAFVKFLGKPHSTLEQRVKILEDKVRDLEENNKDKEDRFKKIDKSLNVLIHSTLSLIEFEMQYCLTEHKEMSQGLEESKKALHDFLAEK